MRRVFVHFDNVNSFGYIIKKIDISLYLVYVESLNKNISIESKNIRNLELSFR